MTWDLGDDQLPRPYSGQDPPLASDSASRLPDDVQDELPASSGSVVRDDGRGLPLIGAGEGEVARSGGHTLEPSRGVSLNAVFGDVKRSGNWVVPKKTNAFLLMGDLMLDLREAQLQPGENRIEVFTALGDVRVLVAPGVRVEVHGASLLGDTSIELGATPFQPGPYVSLFVSGLLGDVKVKAFAPGEKPSKRWRWF